MRRLLLAATIGLLALPIAACANSAETPTPDASTPAASGSSNTEEICKEIDDDIVDEATFQPLSEAVGELLAYRQQGMTAEATQAEQKIKDQLTEIAGKFTEAGEKANDPALKAAVEEAAGKAAQATDLKILEGVTSAEDAQLPLTSMAFGWVSQIALLCGRPLT